MDIGANIGKANSYETHIQPCGVAYSYSNVVRSPCPCVRERLLICDRMKAASITMETIRTIRIMAT